MESLIARLKARHQQARERGGDMMMYGDGEPLMIEAVNEIERLRSALAEIGNGGHWAEIPRDTLAGNP